MSGLPDWKPGEELKERTMPPVDRDQLRKYAEASGDRNPIHLSDEAAEGLMEIAHRKREESTDLWQFTHLINQNYPREKKKKIVEAAWQIIYSDKKLNQYEDHLVHKLAKLLQLDHDELIEAKLKIKYS